MRPRGFQVDKTNVLILPALVFLLFFFIVPLFNLLANSIWNQGFTLEYFARFFGEPAYLGVLWNTVKISVLITVLALVLGYPVGYMLITVPERVRNIMLVFVLLPFWTSFLVRIYAWIVILQKEGIVNQMLLSLGLTEEPVQLVHNTFGVVVGMTHVLLPFMILPLYSVMKGIDLDLVKAAQSMGAKPATAFYKIFLPLTIPGIVSGSILVFIICIGYYVTPALLGGAKDTMISQVIAQQIGEQLNWGFGSAISIILLIVVFVLLYVFNKFSGIDKISLKA